VRTVRVYREGQTPSSAVEAQGVTPAAALRNAIRRMGLGPGRTKPVRRETARHRVIEWAGVTLHVLEEARSGTTRTDGSVQLGTRIGPNEAAALERLVKKHGTVRHALERAILLADSLS